ncbi:MAG: TldD/PmbA family protein [Defluviitaleaceae bacterium]|nr:TldD/PmbA family protein [Defluviitaleaceae bacterium]MCL2238414.1 TldD/PmbA family protein [Defluviitaleaceae bacterium]
MLQDYLSTRRGDFKDYTELRAQVNTIQRVTLLSGNMTANSQEETGGVCARVYRGGTYGFASAAAYSADSVANVLKAAGDNAAFMDTHVKKGMPPLPRITGEKAGLRKFPGEAVNQSLLIDFAKELDALIVEKCKHLSSRTVISNVLNMEKLLVVSEGADSHFYQPRAMVYVFMTAETPDGDQVELLRPMGGFGHFDEYFTDPTLYLEEINTLYEQLMAKREGIFADAGMHKCILHPDLAGMLAHEAIGHTVEADLVLGGSVAGPNLNKPVASELVNMVDFAHTAFDKPAPLPVYVDDEGVPAEDVNLIEKGILKSFMHNRESARHFGVKPQGNARAFAFNDEPLIRMRNTFILPGKDKLADMIASVDNGYYLVKTGSGQADATGEFMFSVDLSYEIKGGKLGKAIRETTMSGVAFDLLKTVDMLSDDIAWDVAGFCGKKQLMTVSAGGPALRCDVNLGGR